MAQRWHHHVKHLVVPHEGNNYRPHAIGVTVLAALLFLALAFEGFYLVQKDMLVNRTDFLASVLPGVLVALTNADREENGLGSVTPDAVLQEAAQLKANDMAAKGYFSHVTPDGKQPWYWLTQAGYRYQYAGENLAVNFEDSKDVQEAWMDSPTHRANIVKPQYTHVGIAVAKGEYKGKKVTFVVQFFATPAAAAPLAAVTPATPEVPAESPIASSGSSAVLGEATPPPAPDLGGVITEAAASPNHTMTMVLSIFALIALVLFVIAVVAHLRMPYLEALGGTAALFIFIAGLYAFNIVSTPIVELPSDTQAAAVVTAF